MNTIEDQWVIFKRKVIPKNASETQINEMKIAFFGGSLTTIEFMLKISDYSEEVTTQMLETVYQESKLFFTASK